MEEGSLSLLEEVILFSVALRPFLMIQILTWNQIKEKTLKQTLEIIIGLGLAHSFQLCKM